MFMKSLLFFATLALFASLSLADDQFYLRDDSDKYVVGYHSGAALNYAVVVPPEVSEPNHAFFNGSRVQFELKGSPFPWSFEVLKNGGDNTPYGFPLFINVGYGTQDFSRDDGDLLTYKGSSKFLECVSTYNVPHLYIPENLDHKDPNCTVTELNLVSSYKQ